MAPHFRGYLMHLIVLEQVRPGPRCNGIGLLIALFLDGY